MNSQHILEILIGAKVQQGALIVLLWHGLAKTRLHEPLEQPKGKSLLDGKLDNLHAVPPRTGRVAQCLLERSDPRREHLVAKISIAQCHQGALRGGIHAPIVPVNKVGQGNHLVRQGHGQPSSCVILPTQGGESFGDAFVNTTLIAQDGLLLGQFQILEHPKVPKDAFGQQLAFRLRLGIDLHGVVARQDATREAVGMHSDGLVDARRRVGIGLANYFGFGIMC
mmetsp:Transcript_23290/g.67194  ORF Transcript_23290/g.67194 Transcript_23290/m.67194 type:complete len:224 (+) Transcript_23290:243-914(+)